MGGQTSDPASKFAAVLRELYEKAGSPPPSELRRQGLAQQPKVTLASSTVDEWLKGISTPSKPDAVMFLVQYLQDKAQRRDGAYQPPSLELCRRLLMDAQAYRQAIRGGRPARGQYPDPRTVIGRTEYQRPGEADRPPGYAFISYVREDSRKVDHLQSRLEAAGVRVWRDTADLWPGEDWRAKIRQAITNGALVFIACFSRKSLARGSSYQNEELALAMEQLRLRRPDVLWLIPVRFDDCNIPEYDIGVGRTLASIQRADLFGKGSAEEASRLTTTVLRILGPYPGVSSAASVDLSSPEPAGSARHPSQGFPAPRLPRPQPGSRRTGSTSGPRERFRTHPYTVIAAIAGLLTLIVTVLVWSPWKHGSPSTAPIRFTVDPRQWQPRPVPGLIIAAGDVVSITAVSGQWKCADRTGYTGIQGSPNYVATYHEWAVPSAPFCSLIGKIGDGPWQQIVNTTQFVADRSGTLQLTANELMPANCNQGSDPHSCYTDNSGAVTVQIQVSPGQ